MTGPIAVQVVYVARNPKDVIVSYYFHHKLIKLQGYTGDMEQFAQFFMDDERIYTYTSNEQLVIYINKIFVCSCVFSVFPSRSGRLVQTASSQFAFHVLRGHEEGRLNISLNTIFHATGSDSLIQRTCVGKLPKWPCFSTSR